MEKSIRLLMLLSGNRTYSCEELQERLGLSERSIYRHLREIEDTGFALERKEGRYRLFENEPQTKELKKLVHFTEEEAYVFYRALCQLEEFEFSAKDLIRKLHALYDFQALNKIKKPDQLSKIQKIKQAISEGKQILFKNYHSSGSGTISDRQVEVFAFLPDYKSVWAMDCRDKDVKQFKISRIENLEILSSPWQLTELHIQPFTDAFRMSARKPLATVEATLTLKAYNLLKEEFPVAEEFIEKKHPEYYLKIPIADFHGIGRFVLGLPGDVVVHQPQDFKTFLKELRKRFDN
ncbi:MAG: WYL domain-containing protein [Moheibacter sp.]